MKVAAATAEVAREGAAMVAAMAVEARVVVAKAEAAMVAVEWAAVGVEVEVMAEEETTEAEVMVVAAKDWAVVVRVGMRAMEAMVEEPRAAGRMAALKAVTGAAAAMVAEARVPRRQPARQCTRAVG